jgi:PPM family protein phosphatase
MIALRAGSATDVGLVRNNNQDQLLVADPLFAVADGMGGAAAGEVASATAIQALGHQFATIGKPTAEDLVSSAQAANRAVWEQAEANPAMRGMGTTLVALALLDGDRIAIVNVGDSRLYGFRDGELRQITLDHNLVAELVAQGRISKEEAEFHPRRNIMTRALGVEPEVPIDLFEEDAHAGDRYLLCSDGLPREVKDDHIEALLRRLADPEQAAHELVDEAKRRGGNDNITVVVVDIVDGEGTSSVQTAPPAEARPVVAAATATAPTEPARPRARLVTWRVVAFIVLLLLVLAGGVTGTVWYARSGYFVGLQGQNVTIFKGRPGGVLWFHPTVAESTTVTTGDILARHLSDLQSGVEEPSIAASVQYVGSLVVEKQQAAAAAAPPPPPPTTVPAKRRTTPTTR